jgi:glycosyltransferase involved in cell wall biosynthesis
MRLTLVLPALTLGGAQRVMTTLANAWAARGWHVHLLTFDDGGQPPFYPLHPVVVHESLGLARASQTLLQGVVENVRRQAVLRRAIRRSRPDVVCSFMDQVNVLTLLATRGLGVPVVVAERSDPGHKPIGRAGWGLLRRWLYPRAAGLVVQTEGARAHLPRGLRRYARVIPNPVLPPPASSAPARAPGASGGLLVGMGRLSEEKGFAKLIAAFADVAGRKPGWSLEIWGEGSQRGELEALVGRLGLSGRVALPGATQDPAAVLRRADLFVLPSSYEGFPNALCEAMACGVPVVSFACPSGPAEIVRHDFDGVLVPPGDTAALVAALAALVDDPARRLRLGARATEVARRFSLDRVLALWEAALRHAARGRRPVGDGQPRGD